MDSDPNLISYVCIAHQSGGIGGGSPTILAEYNRSGDSSLPAVAYECLLRTPPHHSIFSHTIDCCAYTFIIDGPFIYFAVSDFKFPKPSRIWFLNRLKDAAQRLIAKHSKSFLKSNRSFTPYCFQTQIQPVFEQLMSSNGGEAAINGTEVNLASKAQSKRSFAVPLLAKVGEGFKKKKRLIGDSGSNSKQVLVDDKIEMSVQSEVDYPQKGAFAGDSALNLGDSASDAKQKVKRIWRRHVWVVLVLDFAVCLILFGVWLMVCRGFQCMH